MQLIASLLALGAVVLATPSITPYPDVVGQCHDGAGQGGAPACKVLFPWSDIHGGWVNVTMANVTACNACAVIGNSTVRPPILGYQNTTAFPDARGCRLTKCELYENRPMCFAATC